MINIEDFSASLIERDGIFFSKRESKISYPEIGNDTFFQTEEGSFWFNHRNKCIGQGVLKFWPGPVFFDIGGGNGFVAKELDSKGISTVLVEPGIQGCLNARNKVKTIICSTLEDASFFDQIIPAIGLFDVVEHIEDDIQFLKQAFGLLKSDGLIFITVPAFQTLWSQEDNEAGHYRRYTIREIKEKLIRIGFEIEYSTYIFSILVVPIFLFRALPRKLGLIKKTNFLESLKKNHERKNGFVKRILAQIWKWELGRIRKGKKLPFGGSCFVIARKKGDLVWDCYT